MSQFTLFLIAFRAYFLPATGRFGIKNLSYTSLHNCCVVAIRHHAVLRREGMRVADHSEEGFLLGYAVNRELRVKDFVAAVLAVGLREHHELYISRIAAQLGEGIEQIVDFVRS